MIFIVEVLFSDAIISVLKNAWMKLISLGLFIIINKLFSKLECIGRLPGRIWVMVSQPLDLIPNFTIDDFLTDDIFDGIVHWMFIELRKNIKIVLVLPPKKLDIAVYDHLSRYIGTDT